MVVSLAERGIRPFSIDKLPPRADGTIPHVSLPGGIEGDPRVLMMNNPTKALEAAKSAFVVMHLEQGVDISSVAQTHGEMNQRIEKITTDAESGDGKARKTGVALLESASKFYNGIVPDQRLYSSTPKPITIFESGEIQIADPTQS